jgi:hypothetical protein
MQLTGDSVPLVRFHTFLWKTASTCNLNFLVVPKNCAAGYSSLVLLAGDLNVLKPRLAFEDAPENFSISVKSLVI